MNNRNCHHESKFYFKFNKKKIVSFDLEQLIIYSKIKHLQLEHYVLVVIEKFG